jgi:hypothetical protein
MGTKRSPQDLNDRARRPSRRDQRVNHKHPLDLRIVVGQLVVVLHRLQGDTLAEHADVIDDHVRVRRELRQKGVAHRQPGPQDHDQPDLPLRSFSLRRLHGQNTGDLAGGGPNCAAAQRSVAKVVELGFQEGIGAYPGIGR